MIADFDYIMQQAEQGRELPELIEEIDTNLIYGGARKISEFEAELLDQMDESFDAQIKMQRDLDYTRESTKRAQEELKKTENAINKYCSETTRDKILLARGWQFNPQKAKNIEEALCDKELLEQLNKENEQNTDKISMQSIVRNAITEGITSQDVINADYIEKKEKSKSEVVLEGEMRDD